MASQKSQDFDAVFAQLRQILAKYASRLKLSEDTESRYGLEGGLHPKHNQLMPLAWISIDKNYVSYHLMPVYGCPKLLDNISKKLRARMQGKSCFNFKTVDENSSANSTS
jgi:hypothetical protein